MSATCSIVIPELCPAVAQLQPQEQRSDFSSLLTLFSRAEVTATPTATALRLALHESGVIIPVNDELPVATWRNAALTAAEPGSWWCADPITMQIDRDQAILLPPGLLQITPDEAQQLITTLNTHFAGDGLRFVMHSPSQWLLHSSTPWQLTTIEPAEAVGRDVRAHFPTGQDARRWRALANEIEMLLFTHPVNQHREAQQSWPISGVWLWGGGMVPLSVSQTTQAIFTDDETIATLGKYLTLDVQPLPATLRRFDWSANEQVGLYLLDRIDVNQLTQLETHWFGPVLEALQQGMLQQVSIITRAMRFDLNRSAVRRWWRRRRTLSDWCKHD